MRIHAAIEGAMADSCQLLLTVTVTTRYIVSVKCREPRTYSSQCQSHFGASKLQLIKPPVSVRFPSGLTVKM